MSIKILLYLVLTVTNLTGNFENNSKYTRLSEFIEKHFKNETLAIVTEKSIAINQLLHLEQDKTIINIQENFQKCNRQSPPKISIIILSTFDIEAAISYLKLANFLNIKGIFLITTNDDRENITKRDTERVFQIMWNYNIYNIAVMINSTNFVTWFPYHKINECGSKINFVDISNTQNPFENKIPRSGFHECNFSLKWTPISVYFKNPTNHSDRGVVADFLNTIAEKMNIKINYLQYDFNFVDYYNNYGHFKAVIEKIKEEKVDLVLGVFDSGVRIGDLKKSTFLLISDSYFILPPRKRLSMDEQFKKIFAINIKILSVITFIVFCAVFKTFVNYSISDVIFKAFQVSIQQSLAGSVCHDLKFRILFFFFLFYSMNLTAFYSCRLSSVLTKYEFVPSIKSLKDLSEASIPLKYFKPYENIFKLYGDKVYKNLAKRRIHESPNKTTVKRIEEFLSFKNFGCVFSQGHLATVKNPEKLELVSRDRIMTIEISLHMQENFALYDVLESWILNVHSARLTRKWYFDSIKGVKKFTVETEEDEILPLSLKHLSFVFRLLLIGLSLAMLTFLGEVLHFNICLN